MDKDIFIYKDGNSFVAQSVPDMISSFGDTQEEALNNLREAIELYYENEEIEEEKEFTPFLSITKLRFDKLGKKNFKKTHA